MAKHSRRETTVKRLAAQGITTAEELYDREILKAQMRHGDQSAWISYLRTEKLRAQNPALAKQADMESAGYWVAAVGLILGFAFLLKLVFGA